MATLETKFGRSCNLEVRKFKDAMLVLDEYDFCQNINLEWKTMRRNLENMDDTKKTKRQALGKGLGALLDDVDKTTTKANKESKPLHVKINIEHLIKFAEETERHDGRYKSFSFIKRELLNKFVDVSVLKVDKEEILKWKGIGIKTLNYFYKVVTLYCQKTFNEKSPINSEVEIIFFSGDKAWDEYVITTTGIWVLPCTDYNPHFIEANYEIVNKVYKIINQKENNQKTNEEIIAEYEELNEANEKRIDGFKSKVKSLGKKLDNLQISYQKSTSSTSYLFTLLKEEGLYVVGNGDFDIIKIVEELIEKSKKEPESIKQSKEHKECVESEPKRYKEIIDKQDLELNKLFNLKQSTERENNRLQDIIKVQEKELYRYRVNHARKESQNQSKQFVDPLTSLPIEEIKKSKIINKLKKPKKKKKNKTKDKEFKQQIIEQFEEFTKKLNNL